MNFFYAPTIFILSTTLLFSGCVKTPSVPSEKRPQQWGKLIDKNRNFYQISPFVYRSEQPDHILIDEIKNNDIDVIINLRNQNKDSDLLSRQGITLVNIPINTWSIDRNDLLQVMKEIQKAQNNHEKVLIHCYHGSDRTGANVAMYRIIFENWKTQDALDEMKHGGYGFHAIWFNIEKIFTPENIKWIREQLANPS